MTTETEITSLASLELVPYIDNNGQLPEQFQGQVGVYAIFDQEQVLQFVGFSRDVYLSLQQHLVRQPQKCYWLKVQTSDRPSRTILQNIRDGWIAENGSIPPGNENEESQWTQAIDVKLTMTIDEQESFKAGDELMQSKLLKTIARQLEGKILAELAARGLQMQLRFNPKLKEKGLLDLK